MARFAPQMNEKHVKGRTAGVEGTYGSKTHAERHKKGVVEATVVSKNDHNHSGGEPGVDAVATKLYKAALRNGGGHDAGGIGDKALRER